MDLMMKVRRKLSHTELISLFKKVNPTVKVIDWLPLINDDCIAYADTKQPILKVISTNDNWYRVYVSKEYSEITWY